MLWRGEATRTVQYKVLIALFIAFSVTTKYILVYQVASIIARFLLGLTNGFKNTRWERGVHLVFTHFSSAVKYHFLTFKLKLYSKYFTLYLPSLNAEHIFQQVRVIANFSEGVQTTIFFILC